MVSAMAVARPPSPAPTTMILRGNLAFSFAIFRVSRNARLLLGYVGGYPGEPDTPHSRIGFFTNFEGVCE